MLQYVAQRTTKRYTDTQLFRITSNKNDESGTDKAKTISKQREKIHLPNKQSRVRTSSNGEAPEEWYEGLIVLPKGVILGGPERVIKTRRT
jgi:hypothetical protein